MAGIEKICELSGIYVGWKMYDYKRNQLQVLPEFRHLFRGDGDIVYVVESEPYWEYKDGLMESFGEDELEWYDPPFKDMQELIKYKKEVFKCRLVKRYSYYYITSNPDLQGDVGGVYENWTYHLPTMKRKMKRLLRCRDLKVKFVNDIYQL